MTEQRRLADIVSADVVGYSRLMGRDESEGRTGPNGPAASLAVKSCLSRHCLSRVFRAWAGGEEPLLGGSFSPAVLDAGRS